LQKRRQFMGHGRAYAFLILAALSWNGLTFHRGHAQAVHSVTAARSNPTHSRHIALMHAERGAFPANTRLRSARTDCGAVDTLPARFRAIFCSKTAMGVSAGLDVAAGRADSCGFIAHLRVAFSGAHA
jgi:hypothetical protein